MSKEIKIKGCPFCSCMDTDKIRMMEVGGSLAVTCLNCAAIGPIADAEDRALSNWNARDVIILPQEVINKLTEEEDGDKES